MKRLYVALAMAGAVLLAGVGLARCPAPAPVTPPAAIATPIPTAQVAATSSTAATLENDLEIIVPRGSTPRRESAKPAQHPEEPGGQPEERLHEEPIIIRLRQTLQASASAGASASANQIGDVTQMVPEHGRLGVVAMTAPGILAADLQLARVDVPPWLLGTRLQLGLDAAVNLEAGAVGVTAGGKGFAGAYGWSRWNLSEQGIAAGIGMRF